MSSAPTAAKHIDFDPFSDEYFTNPFEIYRQLRDHAPVYFSEKYNFWALSRYADVAPSMKDHQRFSSAKGVTLDHFIDPDALIPEGVIIMMDPPQHTRMRSLVNKVFTPRAIAQLEPMVREIITGFAAQVDPRSFDAVEEFSALFPVEVITTMLGVPPGERQQIRHWVDALLEREPNTGYSTPASRQAAVDMWHYYHELVQWKRAHPGDDMISRLTEVEVQRDDGTVTRLSDFEISAFASMLGGAGAETVAKLIGSGVVLFAKHPEQWQLLRNDRSLLPAAFEELLRYEGPSQYNIRWSTVDVEFHGVTIPKDSAVMMINGSATRDERAFEDPDRFDITRKPKGHNLGFGYGIHSCLGAALARLEGRIALDVLCDMIPDYEVDTDGLERVKLPNVFGWKSVPVRAR
ncbi:cytochrome P450 family protein [Mycolicibacterium hassiacum DSM 44199]|uniref:Steroid C26-monooxygenase n=1 Tax=Mycolicibacterium hassiacum (strain DSM 44199 / CIP 105218 / JCM 12690 / 3849) TaxID=1122247 RepID=K5BDC6_MYCHD|nr:cytochrome P450 [Mycolicibacterium hassiacum]EKF25770.1 cytochrome P450 family protein [Mycolicibacterium hassiacum DSM 44199]MBX5489071.1 cytochrome P450 [Mycolicibacterium hassiacum]MDA4086812.1 cytochrome P450 [Mycolicibacterium hassiacum DSM 44199]PZN21775.1 MAG: cytochrome P450 [Mycolicibacterium hassiacum]VCT92221.1 Putative cytochrome P450 123 [Mycolicibacterium hassiacum DSM 44199]